MIQTSTLSPDFTANEAKKEQKTDFLNFAEPSVATIQTILNYSKNLEVKSSNLLKNIEFVKS